jgi:ADP-heptose:LPS heptosyltransferase
MDRPERIDRKFLYWLTRRLYAARTAVKPESGVPGSLLVVRVDERVGNLVTLQSLLDAIRSGLPDLKLGLLASVKAQPVARNLQSVDHLYLLDKRWFFVRPARWRRVVKEIRAAGYQVALNASAWHEFSYTHAALTFYSGAPVRIGYRRGVEGFLTDQVDPGPPEEYELAQRMRLLVPVGLRSTPPVLRTSMGKDRQKIWQDWLESRKVLRPVVGFWPGSRKPERRWPVAFYARLAGALRDSLSVHPVILWGPGEESIRDQLAASIPGRSMTAPASDLIQLAGLLRCLDLLVTNDTGPMHLSVAVGTPTVCLFATDEPGEPARWGHPYDHVRNLNAPGARDEEVDLALGACRELLEQR